MLDFEGTFRLEIEKKEQEIEGLKNINNMQKSILDSFAGIYWWKNLEGVYQDCNRRMEAALGLNSLEDIIGKTDYELPWSEEADTLIKHDNIVISTGETITKEELIRGKDGALRVFLVTKAPFKNINGETVGSIGCSVDISQQKKYEAKLTEAVKKLESASSVKSEFIANMSHDLRTPMTGIIGMFLELRNLVEELPDNSDRSGSAISEIKEFINVGERSSGELLSLFNEILEAVSLQSGKIKNEPKSFSLTRALQKNIDLSQSTAYRKGIALSLEIEANMPEYLYGLKRELGRTLLNLVSNAIKFTKEGRVTISASVISESAQAVGDTIQIQVCVEDTGIGIPEDKFEEIFENFSKLTSSYKGVYKGYGLGLYAVKKYVKEMGGTVGVESTTGEGSRFTLNLPFIVSDYADHEEEPPFPVEIKEQERTPIISYGEGTGTTRVLLTEDSAPAAMAIISVLKRQNCLVDHAETGEDAVSMAKENSYDIIFMDVGLPGISGLEATKEIRKFSFIPVIALTGHVDKEGICLEAGMQELLAKPANPATIEAILDKYVLPMPDKKDVDYDTTIIDWNCCVKMLDNSEAIAKEILQMCAEDLTESSSIINKAYLDNNIRTLRSELHKVRGGVCYLKLPELERALKDFHLTAREHPQDPKEMEKHYEVLKHAIQNFQEAFLKGDFKGGPSLG